MSAIAGRQVVVVDAIIYTGRTRDHLPDLLRTQHPASLWSCVPLPKPGAP